MKARSALSEASRNVLSGTSAVAVLGLIFGVALAGLSVAEARGVVLANSVIAEWQSSGASVYIVTAPGAIDARACEGLKQSPRVRYSGAIRELHGGLPLAALPVASAPAWEVTPGFSQLILSTAGNTAPAPTDGGILLSAALAEALGRRDGSVIATTTGDALVTGVFRVVEDGRSQGLRYAALEPVAASGLFDACWAEVWPPDPVTVDALGAVLANNAPADQQVDTSQYNTTRGTQLDAVGAYTERLTRFSSVASCLVGIALGFAAVRRRRLELASNLHAGVSRLALGTQLQLETMIWSLSSVLLAAPWMVGAALLSNPLPGTTAVVAGLGVLCAGWAGTIGGTAIGFAVTREAQLFAYFKERL